MLSGFLDWVAATFGMWHTYINYLHNKSKNTCVMQVKGETCPIMDVTDEPQLAPPGAGLPAIELLGGRMVFGFRCLTGNRDRFNNRIVRERKAIQQLIASIEEKSLEKRVLIRRPPGLEDSSRYWSVLMTLDHLRIVNLAIKEILVALGKGIVPEGTASTATVKPDPEVSSAVINEYEKSCDSVLAAAAAVTDLKTRVKYAHPWFGPLDAFAWYALVGVHMGIHRVQIERIIQRL